MTCRSGGYFVEQEFVFQAEDFDMNAFNLTASVALDEQTGIDETGLLIASRMVDRFRLFQEDNGLHLVLISEKVYPESMDIDIPPVTQLTDFTVRPPDLRNSSFWFIWSVGTTPRTSFLGASISPVKSLTWQPAANMSRR